jgi:hypothetical protein
VIAACERRRMSTNTIDKLNTQIEHLVREYIAAQRASVAAAVERAFASSSAPSKPKAAAPSARAWGRRRPPTEVAELAERLFDAVRAHPGETMSVIAPDVGEPARMLNRPMMHLKRTGRVRSAGQRSNTRYFPMASSK